MKKIFIVLLCIIMGFAVGFFFNSATGNDVSISGSPEENVEQAKNSASKLSKLFVKSLLINDFDTALETMQFEEGVPISPEDIEFIYPNTSFANLLGFNSDKYTISADVGFTDDSKTKAISVVTVKDKKSEIFEIVKVNVIKKDKIWAIDEKDFYFENIHFTTPGGKTEVFINDKRLSDDYFTSIGSKEKGMRVYFLPKVGKKPFIVRVKSNNFEHQQIIEPLKYNVKKDDIFVFPPVSNEASVLQSIKNIWNGMYKEYINNTEKASFDKYINKTQINYDISELQRCFAVLDRKENGSHSKLKKESFSIINITNNEMFWITDTDVFVKFKYELSWYYLIDKQFYTMKRNSSIQLEYNDGKYKISQIPDLELFLVANRQIQE